MYESCNALSNGVHILRVHLSHYFHMTERTYMPRRPCSDQNLSTSPCPPLIVVLDPVLQVQFREFRIGPPSQRNQYHSCQVMMMMMMMILMMVVAIMVTVRALMRLKLKKSPG